MEILFAAVHESASGTSATSCDWSGMAAFAPEAETRGLLSVQIMLAQLSAGAFVERGPGTIAPRGRPERRPVPWNFPITAAFVEYNILIVAQGT